MSEGPSDRELLETAEHNSNVMLDSLNRIAKSMRDATLYVNGEIFEYDRRLQALTMAQNFVRNATNQGIVNHASVLYIAKEYDAFLRDGTLPDLKAEAKEMAGFVWNYLAGAFPAEVLKQIKEEASA